MFTVLVFWLILKKKYNKYDVKSNVNTLYFVIQSSSTNSLEKREKSLINVII